MPNRVARDWVVTLIIAAAIGIPVTFIAVNASIGLVHGGGFGLFFFVAALPGLTVIDDMGWPGFYVVQALYFILIAILVRNVAAYAAKRMKEQHAS